MECAPGTTVLQWLCPHGCPVQFGRLVSPVQLDEDGELCREMSMADFELARQLHLRGTHGYAKSDDDDE